MDPSNNVNASKVTMADNLDGITGIGAQNSSSESVTGTCAQLNLSKYTDTSQESDNGYHVTSPPGVEGGCTQESVADSTNPGQPSLTSTLIRTTSFSQVTHIDSPATIVPTLTGDNQDFTPSKTAATGLLLLVGSTEEFHESPASSNRGRGVLASFLSKSNSTPNSTMPTTRLAIGRLSNRYDLRRNQHDTSSSEGKGSSTSTTSGKRKGSSAYLPSEPPRKKTRTNGDCTASTSKPQGTRKTTTEVATNKGCSSLDSKDKSSLAASNQCKKVQGRGSVPTPRKLPFSLITPPTTAPSTAPARLIDLDNDVPMVPVETDEQRRQRLSLISAKVLQVARWNRPTEKPTVWEKHHEIIAIAALIREVPECTVALSEDKKAQRQSWWDPARNRFTLPEYKITRAGLVKTNTDMVKAGFDGALEAQERLLKKPRGHYGRWADMKMSEQFACITRYFFYYWCFYPELGKQQAYEEACKLGVSFKVNKDFETFVTTKINERCHDHWTKTVKTLMDNAIVREGKDDVDLGITGQYYMFEDENFSVRALEEFLTTRNYELKHRDVHVDFKMWLQKKASKAEKKQFAHINNIYSRMALEQRRKDFLELHDDSKEGKGEEVSTPTTENAKNEVHYATSRARLSIE